MHQSLGWTGAWSSGLHISSAIRHIQITMRVMSLYFFTSPNGSQDPGGEGSVLAGTGFFLHLVAWRGG